jgi:hypothetical protein
VKLSLDLLFNLTYTPGFVGPRDIIPNLVRLAATDEASFRKAAPELLQDAARVELHGVSGPYMRRYDLGDDPSGAHCYVHEILRADEDSDLHSHPWDFVTMVLVGGYEEERVAKGYADKARLFFPRRLIVRKPGSVYAMRAEHEYHRISQVFGGTSWSLVFTSPKRSSWDFWDLQRNEKTPWRDRLQAKGLLIAAPQHGQEPYS